MEYKIIRSKRKTISLSINKEGEAIVRAGYTCPKVFIDNFVLKNEQWLEKQMELFKEKTNNAVKFSEQEIKQLKKQAKVILTEKTKHFSDIMQLYPEKIKITSATTRWGSCSYKNNICYSYRVLLLPENCQDYIVVHELSHIQEKNHSLKFYTIIQKYLPNYKQIQKEIRNFKF